MTTRTHRNRSVLRLLDLVVVLGLVIALVIVTSVLDGGTLPVTAVAASPIENTTSAAPRQTVAVQPPARDEHPSAPVLRAPLTGERIDDQTAAALRDRRTVVVKIDDAPAVRTHPGLEDADLVYEVLVEGGLTRYLAVYQSRSPQRVGPVRSVRTTDFKLMGNLGVPILAFSGGNPATVKDAMKLPVIPMPPDGADHGIYWRDTSLAAPHNLFLSPAQALAHVLGGGTPVAPFANARTDGPMADGTATAGITIRFSDVTDSSFAWDAAAARWRRYQRGGAQLDGGGKPLEFDNVLVLFTLYGVSPYDAHSPEGASIGLGSALLLNGGKAEPLIWSRSEFNAPFVLAKPDGSPVDLPAGRTWVAFPGGGTQSVTDIGAADAAAMLAGR